MRPALPLSRIGLGALAIAGFVGGGWLGWRWLAPLLDPRAADTTLLQDLQRQPPPGSLAPGGAPSAPASAPGAGNGLAGARPGASSGWGAAARTDRALIACLQGGQAEIPMPADPSNYAHRESVDWKGQSVPSQPLLIVLHETVVDEAAALALFRRPHPDDADQASYHLLIGRDGRRIRVVDDRDRAYGAGDSAFGELAVQLKPQVPASVNNVALHVSLVSPPDGADGERREHSGYSEAQYRSLAGQIALWQSEYGIDNTHVVTHQQVDRSGSRRDPRSLDWQRLGGDLQQRQLACGATPGPALAGGR